MSDTMFSITDAATVATGLMAGVYFIYAVAIMPGLRRLDDSGFVAAFQATDRAIINPIFLVAFFAPTALCGISAFTERGHDPQPRPQYRHAFRRRRAAIGIVHGERLSAAGDPAR